MNHFNDLKLSPLAIGVRACFLGAMTLAASASMAQQVDIASELQLLKARITQLESELGKVKTAPAQAGTVDVAEFNRIRVKAEAMEDNYEAAGLKGLKINGFMDPTFISNQARKSTSMNFLNNFDGRDKSNAYAYDNSYFGNLWLDFQKEMEGGTKWRFTMAPHKSAASGYNLGSIVHEASVSVPLGDLSTRFIAGQIPDWSGYEYIPSTQNKLITHNLLFDFTMPNFYQGAGMEFSNGKWLSKFLIGNMNATRFGSGSNNELITARVDYAKGEYDGFGAAFQKGRQASNGVFLAELDGYFIRGPLTLQGQVSTGRVNGGAYSGNASWKGISALGAYKLTPQFELVARLDVIRNGKNGGGTLGSYNSACDLPERDSLGNLTGATVSGLCPDSVNGFGSSMAYQSDSSAWEPTGKGVSRSALSLGLNYLYSPNVTFKAEYRIDRANGNVFYYEKDGSYRNKNGVFGLSAVVSF